MLVTLPKNSNALETLTSIMESNEFSIIESKPLVTRLSFKGLTFKIGTHQRDGYRVHYFKPNTKWMTNEINDGLIEYKIDFDGLKKELTAAYNAKANREGLKKATIFQFSLYQIYLKGLLQDIGINPEYITFYSNSKKNLEFQIREDDIKYFFTIKTYSNKDMEAFTSTEFNKLIGDVSIKNGLTINVHRIVNITEFVNTTVKDVHEKILLHKTAYREYFSKTIPFLEELDRIVKLAKLDCDYKVNEVKKTYPILSSIKDDINAILKND